MTEKALVSKGGVAEMAEKMWGLVLTGPGQTVYKEVDKPECGDRDIIIKVKSAAICGGDVGIYRGTLDLGVYDIVLGHEFAGVVAELGAHADKRFRVGDRIISENTSHVCGHCPACERGNFVNCAERKTMGVDDNGAFTQYVRIPGDLLAVYPNCVFSIPDEIGMEEAPLLEPASNCYTAVVQEGKLQPGESIVIFGAGAIALFCVQWAKVAGAGEIIVLGMEADQATRLPKAKELGATHCWLSTDPNVMQKINKVCGNSGVATVIDAAGAPICMKMALDIIRNDGIVVRVGMNDKPYVYGLNQIAVKSVRIEGHMGYNTTSWRNTINMVRLGKFNLKTLITDRLPLFDVKKGFEMLRNNTSIKIVLDPEDFDPEHPKSSNP